MLALFLFVPGCGSDSLVVKPQRVPTCGSLAESDSQQLVVPISEWGKPTGPDVLTSLSICQSRSAGSPDELTWSHAAFCVAPMVGLDLNRCDIVPALVEMQVPIILVLQVQ